MGVLEAEHAVLAHDLADRLGRIAAGRQELGVGAAIGHAEQDVGVVDQLLEILDAAIGRSGKELGLEILLDAAFKLLKDLVELALLILVLRLPPVDPHPGVPRGRLLRTPPPS